MVTGDSLTGTVGYNVQTVTETEHHLILAPQPHAGGNLALIYSHAQVPGPLPKLDPLLALAGPAEGATPLE
jgi:hypothetical protein